MSIRPIFIPTGLNELVNEGTRALPEAMPKALVADRPLFDHHGMSLVSAADGRAFIRALAAKGVASLRSEVRAGNALTAHGAFKFILSSG